MADNTQLNAGTGGDVLATDDIAGVKHQRVKLEFGVDGTAADVSAAAPLPIDQQAQSPQVQRLTSANLTAGGNVDLTAADIVVGTGRLVGATIGASVALRCDLQTISGTRTTRDTVFTRPGKSTPWRPPHKNFITQVSGVGKAFGASVTNLDPSRAADIYVTLYWEESS